MKMINKQAIITLLLAVVSVTLYAQKLPEVQITGIWAPANIKVDAKLNEWNDTFEAFNKATDIYYTMANDDANLYLVVKSINQANNNKIVGGGINITINTAGKKKDKDAFIITFPVVDLANLRSQVMAAMRSGGAQPGQMPDSAAIANMRKKAITAAKEIKLIGFKDLPDSVISIYNELGIKARMDFDSHGALAVEMAIPLKYLNLGSDKASSFAYNIKLNGIQINSIFPGASAMIMGSAGGGGGMAGGGFGGGGSGFGGGAPGGGMPAGMGSAGVPRGMADIASMISATDFWGKYTLAKK
jgi:hypothetical protein